MSSIPITTPTQKTDLLQVNNDHLQVTLENESTEAVRNLKAAAKTEKELRHQLGKVRFAAKEFEDSYNLIYKTREEALAKVPKPDLYPTM